MATITANITSSDTVIPTSAEVEIGYYTLDSENIYVTGTSRGQEGRAFDRLFASINRAVGGSTAATHTSGATLTRYYPDASTSGAAQTVSLLGPFEFVRASSGDNDDHDTGLTIPAGALLMKAFAVIITDTTDNGTPGDLLDIRVGGGPGLSVNIYDLAFGYPNTSYAGGRVEPGNDLESFENARSFFALQEVNITVKGNGGWSGGQIDVFALIAETA